MQYLSTGCSFRSLAFTFRMGKTSVARILIETFDIGVYGRESDGGVLKNSVFFSKLQKKELSIPDDIEVPNTNIIAPYIFIGDEAFPLLTNIQRPYPGKQLINDEKKSRAAKLITWKEIRQDFVILEEDKLIDLAGQQEIPETFLPNISVVKLDQLDGNWTAYKLDNLLNIYV
ncbi:protein ALP1-like isoform X1 [Aphis craccivora]|uniref:Protein ALP1-like isoform X1 n=1 Tax=Aphis craccivora TaxID=307492 RepID=A0A6G0Y1V8_APHCR|nr:protein ALP1-like isoform X1 [Aphis craccivora]